VRSSACSAIAEGDRLGSQLLTERTHAASAASRIPQRHASPVSAVLEELRMCRKASLSSIAFEDAQ
jgi:hypothetical protein